jgi:hypothetical protein
MHEVAWEFVFMMLILKLPIVYLCGVVWWAIRAEPYPLEGEPATVAATAPGPSCPWHGTRRRKPRSPRGGSSRMRSRRRARVPA